MPDVRNELQLGVGYLSSGAIASGIDAPAGATMLLESRTDLHIGSDIDIRLDCAADDWTPARAQVLAAKNLTYGVLDDEFSWQLDLLPDGRLRFYWSDDGTFGGFTEAYSTVPVGVPDGTRTTVRVVLDANDGNTTPGWIVSFFVAGSVAGPAWSQLGAAVTGTGETQIAETSAPIEIGSANAGQPGLGLVGVWQGRIWACEIWDAFFGERIVAVDLTTLPAGVTSFVDAQGNTWQVWGSMAVARAWVDATGPTRTADDVVISRGLSAEGRTADPADCTFTLDNRTGDYSPRNPTGQYYGQIGRNTPHRASSDWPTGATPAGYLLTPRATFDYAYCLDSAALSITGDLDVRVDVDLPSWQIVDTCLAHKALPDDAFSWRLMVDAGGVCHLRWADSGEVIHSARCDTTVPLPYAGRKIIRATLDVNDGAGGHVVRFYAGESLEGPWEQIGTEQTGTGTTSIADTDTELAVGGYWYSGGQGARWYGLQVRAGLDGTVVAGVDFTDQPDGTRVVVDAAGNRWRLAGTAEIRSRDDRHYGLVSEWPQRWDRSDQDRYTPVSSNGLLRRLGQGSSPLRSTLHRGMLARGGEVIAYWPAEDSDGATVLASALPGRSPMTLQGDPNLAAFSGFACSESLPTVGSSTWLGFVPDYTVGADGAIQLWFLLAIPDGGLSATVPIVRIWTRGGTVAWWQLHVTPAGDLQLYGFSGTLATVVNSGLFAFDVNGRLLRISIDVEQNGSDVDWAIWSLEVGASVGYFTDGTASSATVGTATRIDVNHAGADCGQTAVGHIAVRRSLVSLWTLSAELAAHNGERAADRIARLCAEEAVPVVIVGSAGDTVTLGPQRPGALLSLLRDAEAADLGILAEPRYMLGLQYRTRASMYAQDATGQPPLALDYAAGHLSALEPTEDDQTTVNDQAVSRTGGSSARAVDEGGPLGVDTIGRYDSSATVTISTDAALADQAWWRLHIGTVDEPRYPRIGLDLARAVFTADPELTVGIRGLDLGDQLAVLNPPPQLPPDPISQLAVGFTERIGTTSHAVEVVCVPASPYRVGVYDHSGSRYDTRGSVLAVAIDATATTLIVATTTGPVWQTLGDLPFDIAIGGEQMTVTTVAGTASPQTFTVTRSANGVVKPHRAGVPVALHQPVYYALGDSRAADIVAATSPDTPDEDPDVTTATRINCGGPAYTGPDGVAWAADQYYSGGTAENQGATSYGTQHDGILQTERWGASVTYTIPSLPAGTATVNLYFSENYSGSFSVGSRVFDVTINGVLAHNNVDVYAQAGGGYKQLVKTAATTIPASGVCTIVFTAQGSPNNAALCMGIEILAEGTDPPPDPPQPDPDIDTEYGWFSGATRADTAGQYTQSFTQYWDTGFRHVPISCTLTYTVRSSGWGDLVQPGYALGNWTDRQITVIVAQPMTPNGVAARGQQAQAINTGAYDGYWRQWGQSLKDYVARGMPEPITEIAWEFNGDWMWHSATNATQFVSAFRRIVDAIRSVHSNALIAFTPNAGYSQNPPSHDATDCWPGSDYVDLIGLDIYDHYPQAFTYSAINTREVNNVGRAKYWEAFADAQGGLPMVFPEWGLNNATTKQAAGGRDNPNFIQWMWDWFQHLKGKGMMFGEAYFNDIKQTNVWSNLLPVHDNRNPNARAKYLQLWGA